MLKQKLGTKKYFRIAGRLFGALAVLAVVEGLAFTGYLLWRQQKKNNLSRDSSREISAILAKNNCSFQDELLCNFLHKWGSGPPYQSTSIEKYYGYRVETVAKVASTGRFEIRQSGSMDYSVIGIDTTIYILDYADNNWWQQTVPTSQLDLYHNDFVYKFSVQDTNNPSEDRTSFERQNEEQCDGRSCFKYKVIYGSHINAEQQFIWINKADYRLEKVRFDHSDGSHSEHFLTYPGVSIKAPENTKPVGNDQIVLPGKTKPSKITQ